MIEVIKKKKMQIMDRYTVFDSPLGLQMYTWNQWEDLTDVNAGGIGSFMFEEWIEFATEKGLTDKQIHEEYVKHWGKPYPKFNGLTDFEDSFNVKLD